MTAVCTSLVSCDMVLVVVKVDSEIVPDTRFWMAVARVVEATSPAFCTSAADVAVAATELMAARAFVTACRMAGVTAGLRCWGLLPCSRCKPQPRPCRGQALRRALVTVPPLPAPFPCNP